MFFLNHCVLQSNSASMISFKKKKSVFLKMVLSHKSHPLFTSASNKVFLTYPDLQMWVWVLLHRCMSHPSNTVQVTIFSLFCKWGCGGFTHQSKSFVLMVFWGGFWFGWVCVFLCSRLVHPLARWWRRVHLLNFLLVLHVIVSARQRNISSILWVSFFF